ncbi:hypothetical protein [Pseudomonas tumuqii]|uniref:hypothetical protein n=1 Tax=Pseudomonas tumuqii TaxID=2715755 RepID=UPI001554DDFB|nr:hypothetical protein [Pseudomonas tumuqii]
MPLNLIPSAAPLRDALYELSLAKHELDADLLDDLVRRYPNYAEELTDFAIELALDALHSDAAVEAAEAAIDPTVVSPAVSRAMSRFQNRLYATGRSGPTAVKQDRPLEAFKDVPNPFSTLTRGEFRAFAGRIEASTVFVAKLRDRQIEPETLTDGFLRLVADELHAPLDVVVAHFSATRTAAPMGRQFYKADEKPNNDRFQTFAEAVHSSGLTEAQQQRLLSL